MNDNSTPPPRLSIRRNIVANYVAQLYVTTISIVMAPVYLVYMGTEAYGLVGFFTMMTAWFQLLDLGLSATLARETARFRGGAIDIHHVRRLLRALEFIFGGVSIAGAAVMILLANQIAARWLNVKDLPVHEVSRAVMLMSLAIPLRWVSGLYRGLINGFERQIWLGAYNIFVATTRFIGVVVIFITLGTTPVLFFLYQLAVAAVEAAGLMLMSYQLIRRPAQRGSFSWRPLIGNLSFSLTIAFTATVWVIITQTDKLLLSKLLPLAAYGIFSLAVVAAGGISVLGSPFGQAILPRLTKLIAEQKSAEAVKLYSNATQGVCVLVTPAVSALCFFAEPILRVWTGNLEIAHRAAPILGLYAVGNGWVALCSFPYYLQYAKGDLRLHFIGNAVLLGLLVPLVVWSAERYGAIGTGAVWAGLNGLYAIFWVPIIHARVYPGHHWTWLKHDVMPIVVPTLLLGWGLGALPWPTNRGAAFGAVVAAVSLLLLLAAASSTALRQRMMAILNT